MARKHDGTSVLVRASQSSRKATIGDAFRAAKAVSAYGPRVEEAIARVEVERQTSVAESGLDVLIRRTRVESGNDVTDRLSSVGHAWDRLQREITHAHRATPPLVTQAFYVSFLTDYHAWTAFRADHANDVLALHTTLAEIEQHRQRLERWRSAFQALGGTPSGSPTEAPPAGVTERLSESLGPSGVTRVAEAASTTMTGIAVVAVAGVIALVVLEGSSLVKRVT